MAALQPLLLLTSPLGDDTLPIQEGTLHGVALHAEECLSRPFAASLTVVSTERAIAPSELVYQSVCLTIRKQPHADRYFNGIVQSMRAVGMAQRSRWMYRLEIRPRLWFLSQSEDCRIFQNQTVQETLQALFAEHGVSPVVFRLYGDNPVREYTTQYNETGLAFAERLMRENGWFYYFEHSKTDHTLVITDQNQSFKPVSHPPHWVIHAGNNVDVFDQWSEAQGTAHGAVVLQDYDPTRPDAPVYGHQTTTSAMAGAATRRVFNWPALTQANQTAADRARFAVESAEAGAALREGHGYDQEFCPGYRFTLARDPFTDAEGIDYALRSVTHEALDESWIGGGEKPHYENSFVAFLQQTPWREPSRNTRPVMAGIFSAIVLGNEGEEIHADSLGRIKVRLMFDHRKDTVAAMAIWARVMQPWSGNSWGWQHLPRVGTEVAVSFMNGDPDSPVVVGSFYNQAMRPVFPIPAEQTRQGFRSRSTLRGTTQDFSELSFDDRKGCELFYMHAQKQMTTEVEQDQSLAVGRDRTVSIGRNERVTVTGNASLTSETGAIALQATTALTLRVGENTITLAPAGIKINGMMIGLNAVAALAASADIISETAGSIATTTAGMILMNAPDIFASTAVVPSPEEVAVEDALMQTAVAAPTEGA
ncbi:type VI secretion system Vgr family protein [Acidisoma sp. C75]